MEYCQPSPETRIREDICRHNTPRSAQWSSLCSVPHLAGAALRGTHSVMDINTKLMYTHRYRLIWITGTTIATMAAIIRLKFTHVTIGWTSCSAGPMRNAIPMGVIACNNLDSHKCTFSGHKLVYRVQVRLHPPCKLSAFYTSLLLGIL